MEQMTHKPRHYCASAIHKKKKKKKKKKKNGELFHEFIAERQLLDRNELTGNDALK